MMSLYLNCCLRETLLPARFNSICAFAFSLSTFATLDMGDIKDIRNFFFSVQSRTDNYYAIATAHQ